MEPPPDTRWVQFTNAPTKIETPVDEQRDITRRELVLGILCLVLGFALAVAVAVAVFA